jgi:hypothetical protein
MIVSRILLAGLLLILGGMVYWVHRDIGTFGNDLLKTQARILDKLNIANDRLSNLQRGVARIGKSVGPPAVKYLVKKPACFPEPGA